MNVYKGARTRRWLIGLSTVTVCGILTGMAQQSLTGVNSDAKPVIKSISGGDELPDFTISILVKEGDPMPNGDGTVGLINDISVNNQGQWLVDVNVSGGTTNRALIRDGALWLANGDPIDPSDTVSSVANLLKHLNNNGDVVFRPSLSNNNSGLYRNFDLLLLHSQIATAPQFSSGTPYIGFFRARISDNDHIWSIVTVNDSDLPGTVHRAMVLLTVDPDTGDVTEDALVVRHDPAPGTEAGVTFDQINSDAATFSVNNDGYVLFSSPFNNAPAGTQGGLYINDMLVARRGDPSPIVGSDYANIGTSGTRADLNNNGDYIFLSTLTNQPTATNMVIVRNNMFSAGPDEVVVQRGDAVPDVPGETIESFGTGVQPHITDNGDVVWYARFTGDSNTNQGLFVNDNLVIQKGVTTVDGNLITTVAGTVALSNGLTQGMVASDNGRFIILRARFEDGTRAALLVEFDKEDPPPADQGCSLGFWKQSHHFQHWVGYDPDDLFCDVFDCSTAASLDAYGGKSLHDVLSQGGGQLRALGRQAVAALLNAASSVEYPFTEAEVIQAVNDAIASEDNAEIEAVKDELDETNNLGCPLSNSADLTSSGSVGIADLHLLVAAWGPCSDPDDCPADLTGSGSVGIEDLTVLLINWGPQPVRWMPHQP